MLSEYSLHTENSVTIENSATVEYSFKIQYIPQKIAILNSVRFEGRGEARKKEAEI